MISDNVSFLGNPAIEIWNGFQIQNGMDASQTPFLLVQANQLLKDILHFYGEIWYSGFLGTDIVQCGKWYRFETALWLHIQLMPQRRRQRIYPLTSHVDG